MAGRLQIPRVAFFEGTPPTERWARNLSSRQIDAGDSLHPIAEYVLDVVSRPGKDSGAPLNLQAVYLNSRGPNHVAEGVRAIAEDGVLQLHPQVAKDVAGAITVRGSHEAVEGTQRERLLQTISLLLHEGDHLTGPPFDHSARGVTKYGAPPPLDPAHIAQHEWLRAALKNMGEELAPLEPRAAPAASNAEEALAELRAAQLLPSAAHELLNVRIGPQEARAYWGMHRDSARAMDDALDAAARNTGRDKDDLIRELADHVPSTERARRLREWLADDVQVENLERRLSQVPQPGVPSLAV